MAAYFRLKELTTEVDPSGEVLVRWMASSADSKPQIMSLEVPPILKVQVRFSPSSFQVPSTVSKFPEPVMLLMSVSFPSGMKEYSLLIPSDFS